MPNRALAVSLLMIFLGAVTLSPAQAARPRSSTPGWLGLGFVLWLAFTIIIVPMLLGYAGEVALARRTPG